MLTAVMVFTTTFALSQNKVTGVIVDGEYQEGLPGATILVKGTQIGTSTGLDGEFELNVSEPKGEVVISFVGYNSRTVAYTVNEQKIAHLGTITLSTDENMLDDIVIMGVADVAKDRQTPVAVSTIRAAEIQEKLGSQEFPEILNTTPSVYASKGGGGFGDSNINIRGFDQRNVAVLINGMPVNDMEGGAVYWSNWAGLSDVTTAMQVQRGLGSSKIAISSVGGTINILTRTSDTRPGGSVSVGTGNNGYLKTVGSYNTGILENGLSASVLLGYTQGDGYVEGTAFEAINYYIGLGYQSKDTRHNFQFTFTGAKQNHDQRSTSVSIANHQMWNNGGINKHFNPDTGFYNGDRFNFKSNYYNKPVASLNYDFNIDETWTLGAVVYGSWGRGGGTGTIGGGPNGYRDYGTEVRDANGHMRFDDIAAWNRGETIADWGNTHNTSRSPFDGAPQGYYISAFNNSTKAREGGWARRSSINSHDWYGTVINMNAKVNENWTVDFGLDGRIYKGYHFQTIDNLMGGQGYVVNNNKNNGRQHYIVNSVYPAHATLNPFAQWNNREKVGYDNDGNVKWLGGFGQVEYSNEGLSVFAQGSISNQWMQRVDYFNYDRSTAEGAAEYKTNWKSISGGSIKGGINYNINDIHNVFVNSGYFSRQPFMNNGVYLNNTNTVNPSLTNEKVFGLELGYGLRAERLRANVNLYRTSWKDRVVRATGRFDNAGTTVNGYATLVGVEQVHSGVEMDFVYNALDRLNITGSFSWGDWKYDSDVTGTYYNEDDNTPIYNQNGELETKTLYIKGAKVGGAPQLIVNLGANYEITQGFKVDANWRYNDNYYGTLNVDGASDRGKAGSMKLPAFNLVDAGASYRLPVGRDKANSLVMRVNVNNVFDTTYISTARTNIETTETSTTWKGIDVRNEVMFGVGRTWNLSLRYNF